MVRSEKNRLNSIAYHISHAHMFLLKLLWIIVAIYYGGALRERYQKWFTERVGWHEKSLTLLNATILGLGGSVLYLIRGEAVVGFISGFFIKSLAGIFHVAVHTFFFYYSFYNLANAIFRIGYSLKTEKAIASFNILGATMNLIHFTGHMIHKHILGRR